MCVFPVYSYGQRTISLWFYNSVQHINSVDPAIRFRVEDNKEDGSIPFLDTIVKPETDGSLSITVYRKHTHTDQYLQ